MCENTPGGGDKGIRVRIMKKWKFWEEGMGAREARPRVNDEKEKFSKVKKV